MAQCGAPTKKGWPCSYEVEKCPHHQGWREPQESPVPPPPALPDPAAGGKNMAPPAEILAGRDLRELGWWLLGAVLGDGLQERPASVAASVMRVLSALGPGDSLLAEEAEEYRLQVRLAFGLPPLDMDGWELARRLLDGPTFEEVQRWIEAQGDPVVAPPDEPG